MSLVNKNEKYTPEEYLALEEKSEFKSEYDDGIIIAMSGGSYGHAQITVNISRFIANKISGDCDVLSNDIKVWFEKLHKFYYPDITVLCGEPVFFKNRDDSILNPTLIVEVLSNSTEARDRGEKLLAYQSLESLREYVLVSQNKPVVEQYIRNNDGNWTYKATIGLKSKVILESIKVELSLEEIYQRVKL